MTALAALIAAGLAYRTQANALGKQATQLDLQRKALEDQQQANARQAQVVDLQLREMQQRAEAYERQQADAVTVTPSSWGGRVPGFRQGRGPNTYRVDVHNGWHRPIRNVYACIQETADDGFGPASLVGRRIESKSPLRSDAPPDILLVDESENPRWPVVRAGETVAFIFHYVVERYPGARITVRFTDDAGLHWQIDPDLHLAKLDKRDW